MNLIKLNAIDSTNLYLKQLAKETNIQDFTVVLAENQRSGRGQMGNKWMSKKGESLTFSVFKLLEDIRLKEQFIISMAVSLGIAEALKNINIPAISIKWPNDIMSVNKKIGGILIENIFEGNKLKYAIMGIGINVNEVSFERLPQASSLKMQTGINFQLEEVFHLILRNISEMFKNLQKRSFEELRHDYENNLFRKDRVTVFVDSEGKYFNGILNGVTGKGELLIETEDALLKLFQVKEVKMIY